jgi:formylglycine-generating enzyme required for sulfatase activity
MPFCAWLRHKAGRVVRLPTEWEWERAARGTDGRANPWGGEYEQGMPIIDETFGDTGPHHPARSSAVGIYPLGVSPDGVLDLCGNPWKGYLNEFSHPERSQTGGDVSRVVRGGSWDDHQDSARGRPQPRPPVSPVRLFRLSDIVRVPHPLTTAPLVSGR